MNTVVLEEPGKFTYTQTERPAAPGVDQALIRIRRVGICGTDIHAFGGRQPFFSYPRILGHELGVEVLAVGPGVDNVKPGDLCAVEPYLNCGDCIACRAGKTNCCASLKVLGVHTDGGMREQIVVPAHKLHPSTKLTLDQLALVETLGIGAHAVWRAAIQPGETVAVVGAGPIGLGTAQFALLAGADVTIIDTRPERLDFAKGWLPEVTVGQWDRGTGGQSETSTSAPLSPCPSVPLVVFDATGSPASMAESYKLAAPGGRVVWVGLVQADIPIHDPEFHRKELTLYATRNATAADLRRVMSHMESGEIDTHPWVTHRTPCAGLPELFPGWLAPDVGLVKGIVEF